MKITKGRIVLYKLTNGDAREIAERRELSDIQGNQARAGETYPAIVVAVFSQGYANLQVMLDGPDQHWCTSRMEGDQEGQWSWPTRETEDSAPKHAATEDGTPGIEHPVHAEVLDA